MLSHYPEVLFPEGRGLAAYHISEGARFHHIPVTVILVLPRPRLVLNHFPFYPPFIVCHQCHPHPAHHLCCLTLLELFSRFRCMAPAWLVLPEAIPHAMLLTPALLSCARYRRTGGHIFASLDAAPVSVSRRRYFFDFFAQDPRGSLPVPVLWLEAHPTHLQCLHRWVCQRPCLCLLAVALSPPLSMVLCP